MDYYTIMVLFYINYTISSTIALNSTLVYSHVVPWQVLIVGGGDGGVLRELARHNGVEEIHMCEVDSLVCEVSISFISSVLYLA